jgi:hypothetical protein
MHSTSRRHTSVMEPSCLRLGMCPIQLPLSPHLMPHHVLDDTTELLEAQVAIVVSIVSPAEERREDKRGMSGATAVKPNLLEYVFSANVPPGACVRG